MKVGLVIGHTSKKKGAYSKYFNQYEYDFWKDVTKYLSYVDVWKHDEKISGYMTRQKDTASRMKDSNYDLVVELHYNAFNKKASGVLCMFYKGNDKMKQAASLFVDICTELTDIESDGIRGLSNKDDRGLGFLKHQKANAILIEPFFGDNKHDCMKIESSQNMACILDDFLNSNELLYICNNKNSK